MYRKVLSLIIAMQVHAMVLFAQTNPVSVDHVTGTANVVLPLFTVKNGSVTVPVSLVYSGTGIKPKDIEGTAGMGWELHAGGVVEREVRGLPDDCKKDKAGNARLGWLYTNNGTTIQNFSISNDNNFTTCADETADLNFIDANFGDLSDTEPDIFMVSAPGLSCKLMFDNNHILRTIPYHDIKVTYTTAADGSIQSFTIVNDQGTEFMFGSYEVVKREAKAAHPAAIEFFKRDFDLYQYGVEYNNRWKLESVKDVIGNKVLFEYLVPVGDPAHIPIVSKDSIAIIASGQGAYAKQLQYTLTESYNKVLLKNILTGYGSEALSWELKYYVAPRSPESPHHVAKPIIDSIFCPDRIIKFAYTANPLFPPYAKEKWFLRSVFTALCEAPDVYKFEYNKNAEYNDVVVPDSSSKEVDAWGYYNASGASSLVPGIYINPSGSAAERYRVISPGNNPSYSYTLSGNNRNANAIAASIGALNKIIYPNGGYTTLSYESNDYYDPVAGAVVKGGGIRIKEIKDYDTVSETNSVVRSFSYIDPASGLSSGKPVSIPQLAFTKPYNGTGSQAEQWTHSTVRLEEDLTSEDQSIMYTHVTEGIEGAGSTSYKFAVPATFWDNSAGTDWTPTRIFHARPSCASGGFVANTKNTYPFPPNPNWDFERGLLKKVVLYNVSGQTLREAIYNYQRTGAPLLVTGLKFDSNAGLMAYAKYNLLTGVGMQLAQELTKNYDLTTGQQQTATINYSYGGVNHKLPTIIERIANGVIDRTYTQYSKDYSIPSTGTDIYSTALKKLQEANVNTPVEIYHQKEQDGQNRTISAQLTRFKRFNPSGSQLFYMPYEHLTFSSAEGVDDFQPSKHLTGAFINDQRYIVNQQTTVYDSKGFVQTTEDKSKNIQTILTDSKTQQPVAVITGASVDQIAVNDFESDIQPLNKFTKSDNVYNYVAGRSGNNGVFLSQSAVLTATVNKKPYVKNYIFSVWIKSISAGSVDLTLSNTGQISNLPYNGGNLWKYYEMKIPVHNAPSVFTIQVKNGHCSIDDILFYPEAAEIATASYHPKSGLKTSETNGNGVGIYYDYDHFGRLKYTYNQDGDIISKKSYIGEWNLRAFNSIRIRDWSFNHYPYFVYTNTVATFYASTMCQASLDGLVYLWDFGDGSPVVSTTSGTSPAHKYKAAGIYNLKLTVTSPIWGTVRDTLDVDVRPRKIPVTLQSNVSLGYISSVVFYKNGSVIGTMPQSLNTPYLIDQGEYEVRINYKGHSSLKSIKVDDGISPICLNVGTTSGNMLLLLDWSGSDQVIITADGQKCAPLILE